MVLKRLGMGKGIDVTKPKLSLAWVGTFVLIAIVLMGAMEVARYGYSKIRAVVPSASGAREDLEAML